MAHINVSLSPIYVEERYGQWTMIDPRNAKKGTRSQEKHFSRFNKDKTEEKLIGENFILRDSDYGITC